MTDPNQSWCDAGQEQFTRIVARKASLTTALHRFSDPTASTELLCMGLGFAAEAATTLARIHAAGVLFKGAGAWLNDDAAFVVIHINREFNGGPERRRRLLLTLGNALATCLERGYLQPAAPGRPAPAQVREQEKTLKVEIVGLPDRTTTTAVTRDESGAIVASTQIERDAA